MATHISTVATWLSQKPNKHSSYVSLGIGFLVLFCSLAFFRDFLHLADFMIASHTAVFDRHEVWRAWTSLFIHSDWGHFASNVMLLIPLSYLLAGYFGIWLIPLLALISGGLVNLVVLHGMSSDSSLLGVSGVVYWMGAVWLTLYLLLDRRIKLRRRFANALFTALVLFMPDKYIPNISYMSHLLGFVSGVFCGGLIYLWNRKEFLAAEKYRVEDDEDVLPPLEIL